MNVLEYTAEHADALAEHYNRQIDGVPFCWSISGDQMAEAIATHEGLEQMGCSIVEDAGTVLGFAIYGVNRLTNKSDGVIKFFCYERGNRKAGLALLKAVETELSERGVKSIEAYPQEYRFSPYMQPATYLSDHLDHVQALLATNGYMRERGEVFLLWEDVPPLPTDAPDGLDLTVNWIETEADLPNLDVRLMNNGENVGQCLHYSAALPTGHPDSQDMAFCKWLGVDAGFQGKGTGAKLLRYSMALLRERGYKRLGISTAHYNHRAFVFYANYGYRTVDWTWSYLRKR